MTARLTWRRLCLSEFLAALLLAAAPAEDRRQSHKLHEALDWMETRGDCHAALPLLAEVAQGPNRNLAARALFYSASCREKLGDSGARAAYERVARDFPDQTVVATAASARLAEIGNFAWRFRHGMVEARISKKIPVPAVSLRVVLSPNRAEAYVGDGTSVVVIDTRRSEVVHRIPLGEPVFSLAVTPDGARILAGHYSNKIRVIDTETRIATTIRIRGEPVSDFCITPDGRWVYVAAHEYGIIKVDLAKSVVTTVRNESAVGVAIAPNGQTLFASLRHPSAGGVPGRNAIGWFHGDSGHFEDAITGLPLVASWLALTPDGSQLWAGAEDACSSPAFDHRGCPVSPSKAVHVISTAGRKLIRTLTFALPGPGWAAPFPDGSLMALGGHHALLLIDTKKLDIAGSIPVVPSGNPAFTLDGSVAYIPMSGEPAIAVVEFAPVRKAATPQ